MSKHMEDYRRNNGNEQKKQRPEWLQQNQKLPEKQQLQGNRRCCYNYPNLGQNLRFPRCA